MDYRRKDPLDYKDILENLKDPAWYDLEDPDAPLTDDAAFALEDLMRRVEEAEERCKELEARCKRLDEARERANEAAAKWEGAYKLALERAKAEREEERQEATLCRNGWKKTEKELATAVNDLETVMAYGTGNLNTCIFCKNAQCYARGGTKPCLPKWRGTTTQSRRSRDSSPYTGEP